MSKKPALQVVSPQPLGPNDVTQLFATAKEVKACKMVHLLPGRLVGDAFCLLEGDPSAGKSVFLSHLAASVSSGKPFMGRKKQKAAGVLWLTAEEDPASHIRPRLHACNANLDNVHFCSPSDDGMTKGMIFPRDFMTLQLAIAQLNLQLLIMDPLVSHLAIPDGLNQEGPVRQLLDQLQRLAVGAHCTMLGVRQLKKDRSGPRITWGLGSVAIAAVARSVLQIDRPDTTSERRVLRTIKCIGGGRTPPYEYTLDFEDEIPTMANGRELKPSEDDGDGDLSDAGDRDMRADARHLLREALQMGARPAKDLISEAAAAGIAERTLRRAKADLKVVSSRIGSTTPPTWEWAAPPDGFPE